MQWLNYHHLYYFHAIATEGSISGAAAKLRLAQPTLSLQLKTLEESLGKPLFERRNRRLELTRTGEIVLEYAQSIFQLGNEMVEAVNDRLAAELIHIQVGALDSVPKQFILELVLQAYDWGKCFVSVLEGSSGFLQRELGAHRVDLVLTNSPSPIAPQSQFRSRKVTEMSVVACASGKLAKLRKGFPDSLEGQPIFLPDPQSSFRADIDHFFQSRKIGPVVIGETQDTMVQKLIALEGKALIVMAEAAVAHLVKDGKLSIVGKLDGVHQALWLTSVTRRVENPVAAHLMRSFRIAS